MSSDALEALRAKVHADPDLARALAMLPDGELFDAIEQLARSAHVDVTRDELSAAAARARAEWALRWIR